MPKISLISISYLLNSFLSTALMFIYFFLGQTNKAAELALISSFILVLLQIFSSNKRNLILVTKNKELINKTLIFRIIFVIPISIIFFLYLNISNLFSVTNFILFFLFSSLWINEIFIAESELKKNYNFSYYFILLMVLLFFSIILDELLFGKFFIYIIILFIIFLFSKQIKNIFTNIQILKYLNIKNFKNSLYDNILSSTFFSSFSFLLSVFVWRFFLIKFLSEEVAIYFFLVFAIASFPSTFLNNFLGMTIIKEKKLIFKKLYFALTVTTIVMIFLLRHLINISIPIFDIFALNYEIYKLLIYSLVGTIIMFPAMFIRLNIIFISVKNSNLIFYLDVLYGILISLVVPTIGYFYLNYLNTAYLICSIISFIFYYTIYYFMIKK